MKIRRHPTIRDFFLHFLSRLYKMLVSMHSTFQTCLPHLLRLFRIVKDCSDQLLVAGDTWMNKPDRLTVYTARANGLEHLLRQRGFDIIWETLLLKLVLDLRKFDA